MGRIATSISTVPSQRVSPSNRLWIACLVVWFALSAGLYVGTLSFSTGSILQSAAPVRVQPFQVAELPNGTLIIATLENQIVLIQGDHVRARRSIGGTVTALAVRQDPPLIYVGTSSGKILVLTSRLLVERKFTVSGSVNAVTPEQGGNLAIAYAQGVYSTHNWITVRSGSGKVLFAKKLGVPVTVMIGAPDALYFGTNAAQVGEMSMRGVVLWERLLPQPLSALALGGRGVLLAGDGAGNAYRLNSSGEVVWTTKVSSYGVQTVAGTSGVMLAGDQNGDVSILSMGTGKILERFSLFNGNAIVPVALAGLHRRFMVVSDLGQRVRVNLALAEQRHAVSQRRLMAAVGEGLLTLGLMVALGWTVPGLRRRLREFLREVKRSGSAYALIGPSVVLIVIFNVVPVAMAMGFSLTNASLEAPTQFVGLTNYVQMWSDQFFTAGMQNLGWILLFTVLKELTFPLLAAELVFWLTNERLRYWFRMAFVVPSVVPAIVGVLLWKEIYNPETGLINEVLGAVGLKSWQHAWLGDMHTALGSVIFAGFPFVDIFAFLVYYGGLLSINAEIFDAVEADGGNWWIRFWRIDLPSIRGQIALIMFFAIIGSIQTFTNIYIFTNGGPGTATYVPGLEMYNQISSGFLGSSSAMGMVLAGFVLFVTFINFRINRQERT